MVIGEKEIYSQIKEVITLKPVKTLLTPLFVDALKSANTVHGKSKLGKSSISTELVKSAMRLGKSIDKILLIGSGQVAKQIAYKFI